MPDTTRHIRPKDFFCLTMSRRTPHLAKQIRALFAGDTARLSPRKKRGSNLSFPRFTCPFPFFRKQGESRLPAQKKTLEQTLKRKIGSEGRIRTCDQVINSHLRYHCATSERGMRFLKNWWRVRVTIPRHADYDSAALPTELTRQAENSAQYSKSLRYPSSIFSFAR